MAESEKEDKIRSVTLRVAIFFGLTTFTLSIAIFYIESILDDTRDMVDQKDSLITVLKGDMDNQLQQIQDNEMEIRVLHEKLDEVKSGMDNSEEEAQ